MRRFALLSLLCHGLLAAGFLVQFTPAAPPPTEWAKVELIQQPTPSVGDGAQQSGETTNQAVAAAPPPAPAIPPSLADLPPVPMPPDIPMPPPPAARPPLPQQAALSPPPAPAPPPTPRPQARAAPPQPRTPPPSPPSDDPAGDPADTPAVRLGEGGTVGTALVTGDNVIPAAPDSRIRNPQPAYPAEAARRGEEGTVILVVHVAPDGSARSVDIRETSGFERLDRSATEAVSRWHFRPAQQHGAPIASDMPVRVRFVLKE